MPVQADLGPVRVGDRRLRLGLQVHEQVRTGDEGRRAASSYDVTISFCVARLVLVVLVQQQVRQVGVGS
jgi:hypothetical protein